MPCSPSLFTFGRDEKHKFMMLHMTCSTTYVEEKNKVTAFSSNSYSLYQSPLGPNHSLDAFFSARPRDPPAPQGHLPFVDPTYGQHAATAVVPKKEHTGTIGQVNT